MPQLQQQPEGDVSAKYEQDFMHLLVRDPHWLYVYWDISEDRRALLLKELGSDLAARSHPVLKVTNISKNESFFVRINEFSTYWYINVADSNSTYVVEIGRKLSDNFFVSILNSNSIATPGDNVSNDATAYFINYNDLRQGRNDTGTFRKTDSMVWNQAFREQFGISSLEFTEHSKKDNNFGVSSSQFY